MKKVFDQTVRDLKREVNKKVLKVPGIEQKVLDATSNEPWGPHGSHLADIAQATRNYHEYQMIMSVLWKRINDTGKNWRHVYKALTVLEYLVANGSERVIDDIREHTYQISTLANFQYIDSSGRDQGNNVRRKSQTLVSLVNDKERIVEVREKAAVNREKMQKNSRYSSTGGMYRPGSYSGSGGYGDRYDDDRFDGRYGSRDEDRNSYGYGREREWGYRDDDKYGRGGESYNRDGEKFDESYGRDGPRDDDYRGRPRSVDDGQYGTRSRSSDRDRGFDDDGQYSSRGSGARAEDSSLDGRPIERRHSEQNLPRKYSEQSLGAPPSYEEAVGESRSPVHSERDGDAPVASAAPASSAPVQSSPVHETAAAAAAGNQEFEAFDEFDPRGPNSAVPKTSTNVAPATSEYAAPTASSNSEMDLLGSLADPFSSNVMALVPAASATGSEADVQSHANSGTGTTFATTPSASNGMNQSFEDPFGDGPFRAVPSSENFSTQTNVSDSVSPFQPSTNLNTEQLHPGAPKVGTTTNYDFEDSFSAITYSTQNVSSVQPSTNSQFPHQELYAPQQNTDILAGILPPSEPSPIVASHTSFPGPAGETGLQGANIFGNVQPNMVSTGPVAPNIPQVQTGLGQQLQSGGIPSMGGSDMPVSLQTSAPVPSGQAAQPNGNFAPQQVPSGPTPFNSQMPSQPPNGSFAPQQVPSGPTPYTSQMPSQPPNGSPAHFNGGNFLSQQAPAAHMGTHPSFGVSGQNILPPQGSTTPVPQMFSQNSTGPGAQNSNDIMGNLFSQPSSSMTSQPKLSVSSLTAISQPNVSTSSVTPSAQQPSKDKFETKSAVWSDTLSRGLVNLNISGPKINPLSDIGIDFDALNRKEKRMEKPTTTSVTSTVNMGKAMGSGSGMGRAGAGPLRPPPNSMMNASMGMGGGPGVGMGMSGPGMGMGGGPGVGMGMGGGPGGGMGMGMGMGMGGGPSAGMGMRGSYGSMGQQPMGMGMNMGMGMGSAQGSQMPPGSNMSGGYNPMMGSGGYTQQPYGGGYR